MLQITLDGLVQFSNIQKDLMQLIPNNTQTRAILRINSILLLVFLLLILSKEAIYFVT